MTEHESFERFVRDNTIAARRYVLTLTRDRELTEDVIQDAFLRAWRHWDTFRGDSNRQAWFIGICRNVAFTEMRRLQRGLEDARIVRSDTDRILSIEMSDLLGRLPIEYREVALLVDVLGYDYATTASILDRPIGTVRSRLSRARAELRELAGPTTDHSRESA